jgi:hypothetical protein
MRMCAKAVTLLAVVMFSPAPALAQEKAVTFQGGGILMIPLSGTADHFKQGYGFDLGVTWNLSEQAGVRVDYMFSGIEPREASTRFATPQLSIKGRVQFGTAAFVFQAPPGRARLYVLAGGGIYHRAVDVSTLGAGLVNVCNPWWFVCSPGVVPVDRVVGSRSTTNVGVHVGFGVAIGPAFVEGRFHYSSGPTFETADGPEKATGKFFPITFGVRF